jgi:Putative prokaryotic signal transducing protein
MAEPVLLTVVPNEGEAEMLCALLRTEEIECGYRPTTMGIGSVAGGGPQEVLVDEAQLARAQEILAASSDPSGDS